MEPKQNYLIVGVFVLLVMAGSVAFALWMGGFGKNSNLVTYQTFVNESVNGLGDGSAVKYRGVNVGKVVRLNISRKNPNKIRIVMQVDRNTPITVGTVAILQMQGITGLVYIELKGAVAGGEAIPLVGSNKIPIIPSAPSQFRQIVDTVPDMMLKFTELAEKLGGFASNENKERFDRILVNLQQFSDDVGGKDQNGNTLISELHKAVAEIRSAAGNVKDITQDSRQNAKATLKNAAETIEKLNKLADNTNTISKQGYLDLQTLLLELKKTARDMQSLSRQIKDDPSQIIIPHQTGGVSVPKE